MTNPPSPNERGIAASVDQALHSVTCDAHRANDQGEMEPCSSPARYAVAFHDCNGILLCPGCVQTMFQTLYPAQLAVCAQCRAQFVPSLSMITKVEPLS